METSETITKISPAFLKAQKEMGNAVKDSKNPFFKSTYADLNSVREATIPHLNNHGISVLQPTVVREGKNYVETVLLHESGEYFSSLMEIIADKANNAQANGSGTTYARRYGLQSMCNIGSADDDGNAASGNTIQTKVVATKLVLEKGSVNWKKVVDALLKGTGTIEQVKAKYTVFDKLEEELIELTKKP